ncbi:MAG TPA: homocysteine S-methyltransferase family protein, partial [Solirubrobacteraceae bacterium]|nr:homocysteine S-methyltransferase family protein [Solirubrobacteraceae bacterium]
MTSFLDRLADGHVLLADGATGTNFQDMGLPPGVAPEEWVFDAPERVRELHRRFAEAGSELVL